MRDAVTDDLRLDNQIHFLDRLLVCLPQLRNPLLEKIEQLLDSKQLVISDEENIYRTLRSIFKRAFPEHEFTESQERYTPLYSSKITKKTECQEAPTNSLGPRCSVVLN